MEISQNKYRNFVRPSTSNVATVYSLHSSLNGEEARRLYVEEVQEIGDPEPVTTDDNFTVHKRITVQRSNVARELSDKDLFVSAQNNDVDTLVEILNNSPDKINVTDDYGWSLLMIACQENSVEAVMELLKRDIDTSIRDKAGNSATSLVIKSKNLVLADLLLSHKHKKSKAEKVESKGKHTKVKLPQEFTCNICNKKYPDKESHLSSTVHNINASKGRKIPANYVIPITNRGYQLMLKGGWDRESGLGPEGTGKQYPIKAVQKKDRKGLGHDKNNEKLKEETIKLNRKTIERRQRNSRRIERDFRREFY